MSPLPPDEDVAGQPDGSPRGDLGHSPRRGLGARVGLAVVLGLLVYAGLAAWADFDGVGDALRTIPLWAPLAACALSLTNYLVRFPRWQRYLKLVGSDVRGWTSLMIYLAGMSLTVSPGKVGEAMKSWLLRDVDGTPLAKSTPIVLAERVTDLCGFIVLIAISAGTADHLGVAILAALLTVLLLVLVASDRAGALAISIARKLPVIGPRAGRLEETLRSARLLLAPRELPWATTLATLGWGLECVGCWLIARSVLPAGVTGGEALNLASVTYAFALSAVAGALVVVAPGGLGVTEGLMASMLTGGYRAAGLAAAGARATALSVTLVTRLCTLWFAMGVGLLALAAHTRAQRRQRQAPRQA